MKRVGRWVFLLVVFALVLGGAGYGVVCLQQYWVKQHGLSFLISAESAMRVRDTATAKRDLEICIRLAPESLPAYLQMTAILRQEGSLDEAQAVMNQMVAANSTSAQAYVQRANYFAATGNFQDAQADIARALELAPDDRDAMLLSCRFAASRGQFDVARQQSKRLLELYPNHIPVYEWMGEFETSMGHSDEAIRWFRKGMELAPDSQELAWSLANVLLDRGLVREATPPTQVLLTSPEGVKRAKYLNARSEMAQGHWVRASEVFQELRPTLEDDPRYQQLLLQAECHLGDCYRHMENHEQQLEAYRRAVKISPKSLPPHNAIFAALLSMGRMPEAIAELKEIMKLPGAPADGQIWLTRLLLAKNFQDAPDKRDWSEVEAAFQSLAKTDHGSVQVAILHAEVLMARNRAAEAEKVLLDARRQNSQSLELWITLAALAGRQQDWKRVAQRLDDAERHCGDSVLLRLTRGTLLLAQLGPAAEVELRKLSEHCEKLPPPDVLRLWSGLAVVAYHAEAYDLAMVLCRQVCKQSPEDSEIRTLLLEVALRAPNLAAGLDETLQQIESSEGKNARWQFGRAVQLRPQIGPNSGNVVDQALQHLAIAREMSPTWSSVPLLIGELEAIRGDESAAVTNCLTAVYLGERNPNIIHRVLMFLQHSRRFLDIDNVIRYTAEQPIATGLVTERSLSRPGIAQELNDFAYVQKAAEQAAAKSTDVADQIWLAEVLEILGLRARREDRVEDSRKLFVRAEGVLQKAVAAKPDDAGVWASLVQFYVRTDQHRAAEEAMVRARQALPSAQESLSLAQLYQAVGKVAEAEQQYELTITGATSEYIMERAADFFVRNGQEELFQMLLYKMITGKQHVSEQVLVWARRKRAWMLYQRNGRHDREEALRLIAQNISSKQAAPQDQWMKIILLAADKQRAGRREAIRLLKAETKLPAEQQYWLVQLYLGQGDWVSAQAQFRHLLSTQADKADYVIAFTDSLISQNELDEAEWWLSWLEKLAPDQLVTVRLRAAFLVRRTRFTEAIALLRKFLTQPTAQAREKAVRQDAVASSLEDFARTVRDSDHAADAPFIREAETLRRELIKKYPEQRMVLALLLAEDKRLDEAISLMEESWQKASMELIGRISHVLFAADPNPKQLQRTEEVLQAHCKKFDRPVPLLLAMARLRMTQRRFEEAESLLREGVGKEGNNVTCLASLALLLAHRHLDLDEALPLVQRAITVAGPVPELLDTRAMVYLALSQPAKARSDLDSAIAQKPNPLLYYHKAKVCSAMGDRKAAKEARARADQLGFRPELLHPMEKIDAPPANKATS